MTEELLMASVKVSSRSRTRSHEHEIRPGRQGQDFREGEGTDPGAPFRDPVGQDLADAAPFGTGTGHDCPYGRFPFQQRVQDLGDLESSFLRRHPPGKGHQPPCGRGNAGEQSLLQLAGFRLKSLPGEGMERHRSHHSGHR